MNDNLSRVIEVDINEILPNRFQPRLKFDEEEILELSDSIKEHGVIQPIVVRTIGDKYEIIAGERRYKASVLAGKDTVPVIVKNLNDKDSAEIALIENIQRKNLTPIEEALCYKKIVDMGYITQENLAIKLGKSEPTVANKIRLLNLSDDVQEALLENKISERHARSLLKLSSFELQNKMLNRIISERLTVRKTDEEIQKINSISESDDEIINDSKKIIEKGETNMNNNIFGISNIPQQPQPSTSVPQTNFDIFGSTPMQSTLVQEQPVAESVEQSIPENSVPSIETPVFPEFNFSSQIPENSAALEEAPIVDSVVQSSEQSINTEVPTIAPQTNFDIFGSTPMQSTLVQEQPVAESVEQSIPENSVPSIETPVFPEFNFSSQIPENSVTTEERPLNSSIEQVLPSTTQELSPKLVVETPTSSEIPVMQPIMEQTSTMSSQEAPIIEKTDVMTQQTDNLFSFGSSNSNEVQTVEAQTSTQIPEFKMPEPIIVTDFSKQYDPVMPQTIENITPTVDFKEVINAIRDCSNKIEKYGFKIDVEEYDLTNLYQVIFKIEK